MNRDQLWLFFIEPKMEVQEELNTGKTNLVVGAAVLVAALGSLPLFSLFSQLLPDPADF